MVSHVSFFSLENSLLCPCFGKFCRRAGCMGGVFFIAKGGGEKIRAPQKNEVSFKCPT